MRTFIHNVYIHLPFCLKKCHFCAFPIHAIGQKFINTEHNKQLFDKYLQKLKSEILLHNKSLNNRLFNSNIPLKTLYLGGGTPSLFGARRVHQIIIELKNIIFAQTTLQTKVAHQITLQLNLQQIDKITQFHNVGINRFSIGIQSFNQRQLQKFNRNYKQTNNLTDKEFMNNIIQKLNKLKSKGLNNLNIDFILDLSPHQQDLQNLEQFVKRVKPNHITVYLLEVLEKTYLQKKIKQLQSKTNNQHGFKTTMDNFSTIHQKYIRFSSFLVSQDYQHYQVSNFALKQSGNSNFSNHNLVYWAGNKQFVGYGMGASSLLTFNKLNHKIKLQLSNKSSHKNDLLRITNSSTIKKYFQYVQKLNQKTEQYNQQNLAYNEKQNSTFNKQQKQKNLISQCLQIHLQPYNSMQQLTSILTSRIRTKSIFHFDQIQPFIDNEQKYIKIRQSMIQFLQKQISSTISLNDYQGATRILINSHSQNINQAGVQNTVVEQNKNKMYQFVYEIDQITKSSIITGFKLLSPNGFLVADQISFRLLMIIEHQLQKNTQQ